MLTIPNQLKNPDFRFILVNTKTKKPIEDEWNTKNNYPFNHSKIQERIQQDKNIGILGGIGNLFLIDSDTIELCSWIEKNLPETFTIQSGSHEAGKYHYYFKTNKPHNKKVLELVDKEKNECKHYGEIQGLNSMLVAPNCLHSSGNRYDVIRNVEITELPEKEIKKLIDTFSNIEEIPKEEINKFQKRNFESDDIEQQLNVTHVFSLSGLKKYKQEYYGNHPIHGSTTGMNFWINPIKNIWCCFRHNKSGGGVAWAIAVSEGLKNCSEAHGKLDKVTYKKVLRIAEDKYGFIPKQQGVILPTEKKDEMSQLDEDIFTTPKDDLLRGIDNFLSRITKIENIIFKKYLISKIAFKTKVGKRELEKQLDKVSKIEEVKNPIAITDLLKQNFPEIEYLINPIIPKGCILIGGKAGVGKSLISLGIAISLKNKEKFLGKFEIIKNPKILYYDLENGSNVFKWRLEYLIRGLNVNRDNLQDFHLEENFNKANIEKELELSKNFDLIILDSYRRFLEGTENDSDITDKFFSEYIKPLKNAGKTIIILHHLKKIKLSELSDDDLIDAFRGSTDIPAQFDLVYGVIKSPEVQEFETNNLSFNMSLLKAKNRLGLPIKNFTFKIIKNEIGKKTEFKFLNYGKLKEPKEIIQDKIILLLQEQGEISRKLIHELVIAETGAENSNSTDRWLKEMVENGLIIKSAYGKYKLPQEAEQGQHTL